MARIIPLKRDVEPSGDDAPGPQGCGGESAQIILFPGVRYERWHEEREIAPASPNRDRSGQPTYRDWLDI